MSSIPKDPDGSDPSPSPSENSTELQVRALIEQAVQEAASGSKEKRTQIVTRVTRQITESFSGPLPHPKHLQAYEQICPGLADRIAAMTEKELNHNITVMGAQQKSDNEYRVLGMALGFLAFVGMLLLAGYCVYAKERFIAGIVFGGGLAVTIVSLFIRGVLPMPDFLKSEPEPPQKQSTRRKAPSKKSK